MKQIIAIFLFVFAMASCEPKCDCTKCAEECKVEAAVDTTVVDTTVVPIETEAPTQVEEGTEK